MELVKTPVPVPSLVLLSEIVGFWIVLQHTPRAVIAAPPEAVILPPEAAEEDVIAETADVVNTGICITSFLQLFVSSNDAPTITNEKTQNMSLFFTFKW